MKKTPNFLTYALVNCAVYFIVLLVMDYFLSKDIDWMLLLVKSVIFGLIMATVFTLIARNKKG